MLSYRQTNKGANLEAWKQYDATELAKGYKGPKTEIFVDQGTADSFLEEQLLPENLKAAVEVKDHGPQKTITALEWPWAPQGRIRQSPSAEASWFPATHQAGTVGCGVRPG